MTQVLSQRSQSVTITYSGIRHNTPYVTAQYTSQHTIRHSNKCNAGRYRSSQVQAEITGSRLSVVTSCNHSARLYYLGMISFITILWNVCVRVYGCVLVSMRVLVCDYLFVVSWLCMCLFIWYVSVCVFLWVSGCPSVSLCGCLCVWLSVCVMKHVFFEHENWIIDNCLGWGTSGQYALSVATETESESKKKMKVKKWT